MSDFVNTEDYLEQLAEIQETSSYAVSTPSTISEDVSYLYVDANTRKITIPAQEEPLGVWHDHNAKTVYFLINKYFEDTDLSKKTCVVLFKNSKGQNGIAPVSIYQENENNLIIAWTITHECTDSIGALQFALCFYSISENEFDYQWSTLPASTNILTGLDFVDDYITGLDPSMADYILYELSKVTEEVRTFDGTVMKTGVLSNVDLITISESGLYGIDSGCSNLPESVEEDFSHGFANPATLLVGHGNTAIIERAVQETVNDGITSVIVYKDLIQKNYYQHLFINDRIFVCQILASQVDGSNEISYSYSQEWTEISGGTGGDIDLSDYINKNESYWDSELSSTYTYQELIDSVSGLNSSAITKNTQFSNQDFSKTYTIPEMADILSRTVSEDVEYEVTTPEGYSTSYYWIEVLQNIAKFSELLNEKILTANGVSPTWSDPTGYYVGEAFTGEVLQEVFYKADRTLVYFSDETTPIRTLNHNEEMRYNTVESITLNFPEEFPTGEMPNDYISGVVFTSGDIAASVVYPDTIIMSGDECTDGVFTPLSNRRYTLIVSYDGTYLYGDVRGIDIPTTT